MAEAAARQDPGLTVAGTKRKRAAFTRTERPIFAIVSVNDTDGNPMILKKTQVSIVLEKDSAKIVDLVTSGEVGSAVVIRVQVPASPKRATPDA
jgi:hypothetical protein